MFLPVLLVRDYGVWAFAVFAVPNVVGAAAMGWVLRSRESSVDFVARHEKACRAFSIVTIAFHLFLATWFLPRLIGRWTVPAVLGLMVVALLRGRGHRSNGVGVALAAFVAALIACGVLFATGELSLPDVTPAVKATQQDAFGGAWAGLLLAYSVGFAASPYFDLTFHRARQNTNNDGAKIAFGVGFGVVFASMILFTLGYTRILLSSDGRWPGRLIAGHLILQSAVTILFHRRALRVLTEPVRRPRRIAWAAYTSAVALGVLGAAWAGHFTYAGLEPGEVIYRIFLGFYGMIFPAYAWLCVLTRRTDRGAIGVWVIAVLVTFPLYWIAFVEQRPTWALWGVAVMCAARAFVRRRGNDAASTVSAS